MSTNIREGCAAGCLVRELRFPVLAVGQVKVGTPHTVEVHFMSRSKKGLFSKVVGFERLY